MRTDSRKTCKLTKGYTILTPAASSSAGLAAIPSANRMGAVPVALTRGKSKRPALVDADAAHVIAADGQDPVKEVRRIAGGKVAGGSSTRSVARPSKSARATALLGILFLDGAFGPEPTPFTLSDVLGKCATLRGHVMIEITSDPPRLERTKLFLNDRLAEPAPPALAVSR